MSDLDELTTTLHAQTVTAPREDGALDLTEKAVRRFVWFPRESHYTVTTLWTAYTHLLAHSPNLPVAPRIGFFSGSPGSGKTRTLEILSRLAANGQDVGSLSAAAMLRVISVATEGEPGTFPVTLFPDELDRTYSAHSASAQDELTSILNQGYKRGAAIIRAHKDKQREIVKYDRFAPVAFAGLATAKLPDALVTRTFIIHTKRARREEAPDSYISIAHDTDLTAVREALETWGVDNALHIADPDDMIRVLMDERITAVTSGRDHEIWSCLFTVAVLAGGEWPTRCLAALEEFQQSAAERVDDSPSARLLTVLRRHYAERPASTWGVGITKDEIARVAVTLDALTFERYDGPYDLRPEDVTRLVQEHHVRTHPVRTGSGPKDRASGYRWADLKDAWERALPPLVEEADDDADDHADEVEAEGSADGFARPVWEQ